MMKVRFRTRTIILMSLLLDPFSLKASQGQESGLKFVASCGSDFIIENGYANFDGVDKSIGHSVAITCRPGYEIVGPPRTTCLSDGTWSKDTICHIKDCGVPHTIPYGDVDSVGRKTTYNQIVSVTCEKGYELYGPPYLTCQANGTWSRDTICVKKGCGTDYVLPNARVNFESHDTTFHSKIPVSCNDGYQIVGDDHITCNSDRSWSKTTQCLIKDCGTEFAIENGYANFTGMTTTYGSSIPVVCHEGHIISGSNNIICLPDGTWSTSTLCIKKDCGRNFNISNGYANFPGGKTTYQQIVPILCNEGYELVGDDFTVCQADGTWSRGSICRIKDCGTKYELENGHVNFQGAATTYHEKITVTCNKGHVVVGDHDITCLGTGKWSDSTKCLPKDCGSDYSIPNARIDFGGITTYNHKVRVICNEGYKMRGDHYITCLENGTWSKTVTCLVTTCPKKFTIQNGAVHFQNNEAQYRGIASVSCDLGYEIHGSGFISCLPDGSWSKDTNCVIRDCCRTYEINHGKVDLTGISTTYKSRAPVSCDVGYSLQGDNYTICQSDGTWSKFSRCLVKDCGTVYSISYGYADFSGRETTFNQRVPVKCDTGYDVIGDPYISCQADGKWTSFTVCAVKSCKNNLAIRNGVVHFFGEIETPFNDQVGITCNTGYELHGESYTTCRQDGSWTTETVCRIKDCGRNYTVANGHVTFNMGITTFNSTATVSCSDGYDLHGDGLVKCLADGTWSAATCVERSNLVLYIAVGAACGFVFIAVVIVLVILRWKRKLCFAGRWHKGCFF